jgi:general secretion pathway protein A
MYDTYYNFNTLPFENTPNPRFFYASEQHREALAAIEYTIRMRKGIVLVSGNIGSGKTTVGRTMIQRCCKDATIVQLVHGHRTGIELVHHVLRSLDVESNEDDDHAQLLEKLETYLRGQADVNRPVVLFIDEAQTLSTEALEELRLISNFDTNTTKLLQLVLVGQPELRDQIASPQLSALRQRIVMAKQLRPLGIQDTAGYIAHRLKAASKNPKHVAVSFSGEAIAAMYKASQGIPRLINVICDNCLLLGFVKEQRRITPAMVRQVLDDMVPSFGEVDAVPVNETRLSLAG